MNMKNGLVAAAFLGALLSSPINAPYPEELGFKPYKCKQSGDKTRKKPSKARQKAKAGRKARRKNRK